MALTITVTCDPADDARTMLSDLWGMARKTWCRVQMTLNSVTYLAKPEDALADLLAAFDAAAPGATSIHTGP